MKKTILLFALASFSAASLSQAAKAPRSQTALAKEADAIVTGTVVSVTSIEQKSAVETSVGVHRDRVYTITINVATVAKGKPIAGQKLTFTAWVPIKRMPPIPGLQGHSNIPKKGQNVTVYLLRNADNTYKPILPNGITINPPSPPKK